VVATRLRNALAIGDVSEIQAIARDLMRGNGAEAALGADISRMATSFDFGGLGELADVLAAQT
jgi:hypothetical protein